MGMHAHPQHPQPALQVVLPQRLVPLHVPVAPEDVVNQDIEAAALVIDGCHQGGHLAGILVINHSRGARPASRTDQITGLLDRLRPADLGRARRPAAAPCRIDEEPSARQLDGNRPARAPGSASHQGDQHPLVPISHQVSQHPRGTSPRVRDNSNSFRRTARGSRRRSRTSLDRGEPAVPLPGASDCRIPSAGGVSG